MKDRRVKTGALAVGAALGVASSADAAVFNVTSNADAGANTLRQAIIDANTAAGADTITFDAALSGNTITLTSGEMLISDSVDIQGLGSANLTVDANNDSRVFYVYNPSPVPVDVTISGLTLTNGFSVVAGDPPASSGGAVRAVGENLTLDDVIVSGSIAGGDGGGVAFFGIDTTSGYNPVSATLTIQNSTITGNAADHVDLGVPVDQGGCGGGVWAGGIFNVLVDNTTLSNNQARCDGGGFFGVYFQDGGQVTIQNSVISGNTAGLGEGGSGGGLGFVYGSSATGDAVTIADSTISGNSAPSEGGGIMSTILYGLAIERSTISGNSASYGAGLAATFTLATIENSTVAENTASAYGGGIYGYQSYLTVKETTISGNTASDDGPGIYAYYTQTDIINSIVANNGPGADLVDDGTNSEFNVSYSLIENEDVATINDGGGNIFGVDPNLGPLQDNGGPTFTMKPAGVPVVNAGDPAFAPPPSTDQRGFARVSGGRIDMGAVELNPGTMQFSETGVNVSEDVGNVTVTVTRTGGSDGAASVQVGVDGTSTATGGGTDYTFAGATINFADNDATPQTFNVSIVDDPTVEPLETIVLTLASPTVATIGSPATHTILISDNELDADLSITKSVAPGSVTQGDNVTFNLTIMNAGPDSAVNVVVGDTLPAQLTYVSATPSVGSCSGTTTITCNLGTLNASASATIQIVATMTGTGPTTNIAAVGSDTGDTDGTDNEDQVTFTILPAAAAVPIPALDPRMQLLLAAIVAAAALGILSKR